MFFKKSLPSKLKKAAHNAADGCLNSFAWLNDGYGEAFNYVEHNGKKYLVGSYIQLESKQQENPNDK